MELCGLLQEREEEWPRRWTRQEVCIEGLSVLHPGHNHPLRASGKPSVQQAMAQTTTEASVPCHHCLESTVAVFSNIIQKRLSFHSRQNVCHGSHSSTDVCLRPETLLNTICYCSRTKSPISSKKGDGALDAHTCVCWFKSHQTRPEPEVMYLYKINCLWK